MSSGERNDGLDMQAAAAAVAAAPLARAPGSRPLPQSVSTPQFLRPDSADAGSGPLSPGGLASPYPSCLTSTPSPALSRPHVQHAPAASSSSSSSSAPSPSLPPFDVSALPSLSSSLELRLPVISPEPSPSASASALQSAIGLRAASSASTAAPTPGPASPANSTLSRSVAWRKKLVLCLVGLPARGKCFAAGTRLRLLSGALISVEDVRGGELLMGDDGLPRVVTPGSLTCGREQLYCIRPEGAGRLPFTVNAQHVLVLVNTEPPRQAKSGSGCGWRVSWWELSAANSMRQRRRRFSSEVAAAAELSRRRRDWRPLLWELSLRRFLAQPERVRSRLRLVQSGPVSFHEPQQPRLQALLSDILSAEATAAQADWAAWWLGLWLLRGDGRSAAISQSADDDAAVAERLLQYERLFSAGMAVTDGEVSAAGRAVRVYEAQRHCLPLLQRFGLLGQEEPQLPAAWLCDSLDARRRLLAGVLDGDGGWKTAADGKCGGGGCYELTGSHHRLLLGCSGLAESLGISCSALVTGQSLHPVSGLQYSGHRLVLSAGIADAAQHCAAASKRRLVTTATTRRRPRLSRFSIAAAGVGGYFGFAVHGGANRRFLLEDYTVTHNSYIAYKLVGYMRWRGLRAQLFNVGKHRRSHVQVDQDAAFFDANNTTAQQQRDAIALEVLESMLDWLETGGDVAVFDATNTTNKRRWEVHRHCQRRSPVLRVIFVESICDDKAVLESNYNMKVSAAAPPAQPPPARRRSALTASAPLCCSASSSRHKTHSRSHWLRHSSHAPPQSPLGRAEPVLASLRFALIPLPELSLLCTAAAAAAAQARNSPDYRSMPLEKALKDLRLRIANYEKVYEPIADDALSYLKLINLNCFPVSDHQLLTSRGFLYYADVKEWDERFKAGLLDEDGQPTGPVMVACPSKLDTQMEASYALTFRPMTRLVREGADGAAMEVTELVEFSHQRTRTSHYMDLQLTGNHELPVRLQQAHMLAGNERWEQLTAADIVDSTARCASFLPLASVGVVQERPDVELPFVAALGLHSAAQLDAFIELYGYWMGDGSWTPSAVTLAPKKSADWTYLDNLLANLGIPLLPSGTKLNPNRATDGYKLWHRKAGGDDDEGDGGDDGGGGGGDGGDDSGAVGQQDEQMQEDEVVTATAAPPPPPQREREGAEQEEQEEEEEDAALDVEQAGDVDVEGEQGRRQYSILLPAWVKYFGEHYGAKHLKDAMRGARALHAFVNPGLQRRAMARVTLLAAPLPPPPKPGRPRAAVKSKPKSAKAKASRGQASFQAPRSDLECDHCGRVLPAGYSQAHNQKRAKKKHDKTCALTAGSRAPPATAPLPPRRLPRAPPRPRSHSAPPAVVVPYPRVPTLPPHQSESAPAGGAAPLPPLPPSPEPASPDPVRSAKPLWWWVWHLSARRLRLLLRGLRFADGNQRPELDYIDKLKAKAAAHREGGQAKEADEVEQKLDYNHREAFSFTAPNIATSSVTSRDQYQRVALMAGFATFWTRSGSEGDTASTGHRNADLWLVHYNHKLKHIRTVLDIGVEIKCVQQAQPVPVWCVEVPEPHLIFVRRVIRIENNIITEASRPIIVSNSKVIANRIHGSLGHLISAYLMSIHIQPRPIYLVRTGKCEGEERIPLSQRISDVGSRHTPFLMPFTINMAANLTQRGREFSERLAAFLHERCLQYFHTMRQSDSRDPLMKTLVSYAAQLGVGREPDEQSGGGGGDGDADGSGGSEAQQAVQSPGSLQRAVSRADLPLIVYTSTLPRALQTVAHVASRALVCEQTSALNMMDTGILHGLSVEEIKQRHPEELERWHAERYAYRFPGGESQADKARSLEPLVMEMERHFFPVLVVSHASTLQVLYGYFLGSSRSVNDYYSLHVPQHFVIELTPNQYGWEEKRWDLRSEDEKAEDLQLRKERLRRMQEQDEEVVETSTDEAETEAAERAEQRPPAAQGRLSSVSPDVRRVMMLGSGSRRGSDRFVTAAESDLNDEIRSRPRIGTLDGQQPDTVTHSVQFYAEE